MHEAIGADDVATIHLANALVAEADAEDGRGGTQCLDDGAGNARFVGRAGTWRHANAAGLERFDLSEIHRIIANDFHFRTELAEILHEVIGEGVVVIDDQQHGA